MNTRCTCVLTVPEFTFDASVPTTGLDGTPIATLKLGIPGLNLSFSQPVTLSFLVGAEYDGFRLQIQSLREDGDTWTDETTTAVVNGRASVTVTHATRFAASVMRPSISRLAPARGRRGATVTITGRSFGKKRGAVRFGGAKCTRILHWSGTRRGGGMCRGGSEPLCGPSCGAECGADLLAPHRAPPPE